MNQFEEYIHQTQEYGVVKEIQHPIVYCSGLPNARIQEQIVFEGGQLGRVLSIREDLVEIVVFTRSPVSPGARVARTGNYMTIPTGMELLGTVVNPVSELMFDKVGEPYRIPLEKRNFESPTPKLHTRKRIERPLETGVAIIDSMLPLGKGQRELVVGDRKTGKTSAIVNVVIRQAQLGSVIVYALIGKNKGEIKRLKKEFEQVGVMQNAVIVATSSDDSPSLIDLCPYSAMTIAEFFKDAGKDVLVVFDDLSTHAKFYRELALLGKTFPGRDSYPGDIFYKHARLLERAGNFFHSQAGEVAITAIPMAETTDGRLNDYIVSNIISITDGHLLFNNEAFNKGRRPAIDIFLSVTRVGKQTQTDVGRKINRKLFQMMSKYVDAENFQHFGAELSPEVKALLKRGDLVYKFFEQPYTLTIPVPIQAVMIEMIMKGLLDEFTVDNILDARMKVLSLYRSDKEVFTKINNIFAVGKYDEFSKIVESEASYIRGLCKT